VVLTRSDLREARALLNVICERYSWREEEVELFALLVAAERKLFAYYSTDLVPTKLRTLVRKFHDESNRLGTQAW
jgi:hypothetical protein